MIKAVFCDFYGTIVFDDDESISEILNNLLKLGRAESTKEIESFWWQRFYWLFSESYGSNFRKQRDMVLISLMQTLEQFDIIGDAAELGKPQFTYWKEPQIFIDGKIFVDICPLPLYIISNVDTSDLVAALSYHDLRPTGFVTSEEARAYKPRADIFSFALEKHGFKANEVIHIGDSVTNDLHGAKSAGIQTIWLNRQGKPIPPDAAKSASDFYEILAILESINKEQNMNTL